MKDILITSSVLILALLVIRLAFKKVLSRRLQYALWALVLVRLLVPANLPAVRFSVLTAAEPIQAVVSERLEQVVRPARPVTDTGTVSPARWPLDHVKQEVPPLQWDQTVYPGTYYPSPADHPKSGMTAGELLALVWKVGMALVGTFFLLSNLWFWLKLRRCRKVWDAAPYGISRKVYLVPDGTIPSPCLFLNDIYLTPAALRSEESLRHVLTHEETHAKHLDPLWSLLRCICLTVYWFDPLVWVAAACAKTDCELACDEAVLEKLGEEARIPYGQTLLSLIPVKRGANPLLTATTMTAGKRQLKDRITRIAQNPRQLAVAVAAVAVLALLISACTFAGGEPTPEPSPSPVESLEPSPTPTPEESSEPGDATPLSEEELRWFNEEYFNRNPNPAISYTYSIRNQFVSLLNLYDRPEDIDLFELFCCDGVELTQEEYRALGIEDPLHPWFKLTPEYIDEVLTRYTGLTLEQTNKVNFAFTYSGTLGAYIWEHGDSNYPGDIEFLSGTRQDGTVKLYHHGWSYGTRMFCTTLEEQPDGNYRFVSNENHYGFYLFVSLTATDHIQEGADVGVPTQVVAAVRECAERVYRASKTPTAPEPTGEKYAWGVPVNWDDWRVLTFDGPYLYPFGDVTVEAWRFLQQLHTPEVGVDGIPEDGWYSNTSSRNIVFFQKGTDGSLTFLGSDWSSWEDSMGSFTVIEKLCQKLEELGLISADPLLEYGFELTGVPGDDMYHVLADSDGNTSFELAAGAVVTFQGTWTPSFAPIQVRLELEDGSLVSEVTLANKDVLTMPIFTDGRYQLKVATGPDELTGGTLILSTTREVGTVWAWGANFMLTKADGTVWSWGANTYGQLSDGTYWSWGSGDPNGSEDHSD